jgi:uncharacterized membrane protein YraQ (UPF0718 family)
MSDTIQVMFWGSVLRIAQAIVEASPTLLCGLLVAGVLRRMVGPDDVRRLFGVGKRSELARAWALGMLLPICSFGVIPVIRELRRAKVPAGTILSFALAAPLLNPLSLLYGLTLSEPLVIFAFVLGSLAVSVVAGAFWTRWLAKPSDAVEFAPEPQPAPGLKRMAAVGVAAARELAGPTLVYCLVGLLGVGLLSAALPSGCLQHSMSHSDPLSPLLMAGVALPAYAPPMKVMMVLGLMFEHGNSVGAAYVLLVLGAGVDLGLLAWVVWTYGWRRMLIWLGLVVALAVALGSVVERPLYFALKEEYHTHAFDDFAAPFPSGLGAEARDRVLLKLKERIQVHETASLGALALLGLLGTMLRLLGDRLPIDAYLERSRPQSDASVRYWNRPIPAPLLGCLALAGLVVFAGVGAYVYYPDPETIFNEMTQIRAQALTAVLSGNKDEAVRMIRRWDDLTRKLQVGVILRKGSLDEEARQCAEDLREKLEDVRDALNDGKDAEAKTLAFAVQQAYVNCRTVYLRP